MCGVLYIEAMDALHPEKNIAARITGVKSFEDLLKAEVKDKKSCKSE